jgi:DNA-binding MarR family transcriptional regulator
MYVHADTVTACKLRQVSKDEQAWSQFVTLHAHVESELTKALQRRHGLGLSEYRALQCLSERPKWTARIQELAESLALNQSSVSRLVARLEEAKLSERDICETDRRGIYTMLTAEGMERLSAAQPTYQATLAGALDKAAADPTLAPVVRALRTP